MFKNNEFFLQAMPRKKKSIKQREPFTPASTIELEKLLKHAFSMETLRDTVRALLKNKMDRGEIRRVDSSEKQPIFTVLNLVDLVQSDPSFPGQVSLLNFFKENADGALEKLLERTSEDYIPLDPRLPYLPMETCLKALGVFPSPQIYHARQGKTILYFDTATGVAVTLPEHIDYVEKERNGNAPKKVPWSIAEQLFIHDKEPLETRIKKYQLSLKPGRRGQKTYRAIVADKNFFPYLASYVDSLPQPDMVSSKQPVSKQMAAAILCGHFMQGGANKQPFTPNQQLLLLDAVVAKDILGASKAYLGKDGEGKEHYDPLTLYGVKVDGKEGLLNTLHLLANRF